MRRRAQPTSAVAIIALALAALLLSAAPALAATVTDRPLIFSFDGSDTTAGAFTRPANVAVDSSGNVYVLNASDVAGQRVINKFNADGIAQNFVATGESSLTGPGGDFGGLCSGCQYHDVAIDTSAVNPGRIYVSEAFGPVHAFDPQGNHLWTLNPLGFESCGVTVDALGHPWVIKCGGSSAQALEFASSGSPPDQIHSFPLRSGGNRSALFPAIDQTGNNFYVARSASPVFSSEKYVGEIFASFLTPDEARELTIDQSNPAGHIFTVHGDEFRELDSTGAVVTGSPFGDQVLGDAAGIAYNQYDPDGVGPEEPLDRVYVSDAASDTVKVFGPEISGTAPDTSTEDTEPIGLKTATAHGTINPLGLPNAYHLEWKPCASAECTSPSDASWGKAQSSPTQSIEPTDANPHAISLEITQYKGKALKPNSWYQVRLVGTNTENDLSSYSAPDTFKTLVPPSPVLEACGASAITAGSAHVACTVDPQEVETNWRILRSALPGATQAKCEALAEGEFQLAKEGTIPDAEPATVPIDADLAGLDPAQAYCVRASATNGGGADSEDLSFSTLTIPPSEAGAAFAAPRTDTTARINARVNPNGEADFEYRFEWKEEGAPEWTALPIRESTIHVREAIVVTDELEGLDPATTYRYRLALAENEAGPAASLGEERTFTTRSGAEAEEASPPSCPANEDVRAAQHATYLGSCRGIELVNSPDKGNQNATARGPGFTNFTSPLSAGGEELLWSVIGGAPGGPNGTESNFLASRTPAGWESRSAAPPAAEQLGGGDLTYFLIGASPGFDSLLFSARLSTGISSPAPNAFVRVRGGVQDVLVQNTFALTNPGYEGLVDMSDDGEHVFALDLEKEQLKDIGAARLGPPPIEGEVVSLMPDGQPSECGLDVTIGESFSGISGSSIGHPGDHWVATDDGSRAYFRARPNVGEAGGGSCSGGAWRLYVRNREAGETTLIDAGAGGVSPEFLTTTPDGHRAYFVTSSSLDSADTDETTDLYLWDEDSGAEGGSSCLTCVAEGPARLANVGGGLRGLLISKDFSRIYFFSTERLVPGEGSPGALNLYLLAGGEIRFVAITQVEGSGDVLSEAELSSDGNVLLFAARASPALTADSTASQCIQTNATGLGVCRQLYRYEDSDRSIECLSCQRTPLQETDSSVGDSFELSSDGTTSSFATNEALVARDVNNGIDLYEWRAGTLHMLTDGGSEAREGTASPRVWAIDEDGSDVFFGVVPPAGGLTGFERDGLLNVYDARIGGGFMPPSPAEACEGDSCQGPLAPPPPGDLRGSAGYQGPGNLAQRPRRCRKGKVRRRGRCVRRRHHTSKRHKRASHAKHGGSK